MILDAHERGSLTFPVKHWRHAIGWGLALMLGTLTAAVIATHRLIDGTFEAPLPVPTGGQTRIAALQQELSRLEAAGKLSAQLRHRLNSGLNIEQMLQAGAVARLTLKEGIALLEYVAPGAPKTSTAHDLRYSVAGFGSGRRIRFEPLTPPTGIFDPPADFIVESDDVIRSTGSNQRFQRVVR